MLVRWLFRVDVRCLVLLPFGSSVSPRPRHILTRFNTFRTAGFVEIHENVAASTTMRESITARFVHRQHGSHDEDPWQCKLIE